MKDYWQWVFWKSEAAPANLFIAFNLFLFLPALLFVNSRNFWNYGFDQYVMILFPLFLLAYGLLSIPLMLIKPQWHKKYTALITGIAFVIWASNFWVGSHGLNDGKTFVVITDSNYFYRNLIVLVLVGVGSGIISFYKNKITNRLLLFASIAYLIFVSISILESHKIPYLNYQQSQFELTTFSKQKNVLIILLDSFQSDFLEEILKRKPEWVNDLNGFTDYINASGTASGTLLALPTIHSGNMYHPGDDLVAFYEQNIEQESIMNLLQKKGYRTMMLNPYLGYAPQKTARINQNYLSCPHFGAFCEAQQLINYSLFNAVPHAFKKYIYNEGVWLLSEYFPSSVEVSNQVLTALATHIRTNSSVPTAKLLHLYSAHAPALLDDSCQLTHVAVWNRNAALNQAQCAMGHVINVIQALKKQHIYDNTTIFVIADHGSGFPMGNHETILGAKGNPLVLFKPMHQNEQFAYAEDLISLLDIKTMICEASHECASHYSHTNNLATILKNRKELVFNYYQWDGAGKIPKVFPYRIDGSPRKPSSWRKIPRSQKPLTHIDVIGDFFQDYAGSGWGFANDKIAYRWAIKRQADLYLPIPATKNARIVFTATTPYYNPKQELTVLVNNHWIGKYPIPVNQYSRIELDIPQSILNSKPAHILFQFTQANSPPNQEKSTPLAIALYGFIYIT